MLTGQRQRLISAEVSSTRYEKYDDKVIKVIVFHFP